MIFTEDEWHQYRIENLEKRMSGHARANDVGDTETEIVRLKSLHGLDNIATPALARPRRSRTHTISNSTPRDARPSNKQPQNLEITKLLQRPEPCSPTRRLRGEHGWDRQNVKKSKTSGTCSSKPSALTIAEGEEDEPQKEPAKSLKRFISFQLEFLR